MPSYYHIISRTDSIGDVVLTLPMAKIIKQHYPAHTVAFLGTAYTKPVINACKYVDEFIDVAEFLSPSFTFHTTQPQTILHVLPNRRIAQKARAFNISKRIGTINRFYHWLYCNRLVRLSRKNSALHEAMLNLKLLKALHLPTQYTLEEIGVSYGLEKIEPLAEEWQKLLQSHKYHLILHPKSQGSAREWKLENFKQLIDLLPSEQFQIFITGTKKEMPALQPFLEATNSVAVNMVGKLSLSQLMAFIKACDGLVACSTGPLHLAAALGNDALGIFAPIKPVHLGRWAPLGPKAKVFVENKVCNKCKATPQQCSCINAITPLTIANYVKTCAEKKGIF